MSMQLHSVRQGTPEWVSLRLQFFTASEAPVVMGASPYMTRRELLTLKATGLEPEIDEYKQRIFDAGHAAENLARQILEEREECDFYPVVASRGEQLASVDGITLLYDTIFEHKLWSQELADQIERGELGPEYYWQLEQQLYVFGAEQVIFVASNGTADNWHQLIYKAQPGRIEQLLAAWQLFKNDLSDYSVEAPKIAPAGVIPDALPALHIELDGTVKASNVAEFKDIALGVIRSIKTDLATDQDFADAEKAIKFLAAAEDRLRAAKEHALSQASAIYNLLTTIDGIISASRDTRLVLDKAVAKCKQAIRDSIVMDAAKALNAHIDGINETLGGKVRLPPYRGNFSEAIKGKRNIETLQAAADSELARCKIEVSEIGDKMRRNVQQLRECATEYAFLFADAQQLCTREPEEVADVIESRIGAHRAREVEREAERETLREVFDDPRPGTPQDRGPVEPELELIPYCTVVIRGVESLAIGTRIGAGKVLFTTPGDWSVDLRQLVQAELARNEGGQV